MQKNVVYNKGAIEIVSKPSSGEVLKVYTRPEDKIYYKFDIKNTKYKVFGNSVELVFDDGAKFVFVSVMDMLQEANPPSVVLQNGKEVTFETIVLKIGDEEIYSKLIETQAKFEEKLKSIQDELANEFSKIQKLKGELEKEKAELFEFKNDKTLTKDINEVLNKEQKEPKEQIEQETKKESKTIITPAVLVEEEAKKSSESKNDLKEEKELDKPKKDISLESILKSDESSKLDEIDSIIRELDIR